MTSDQYATESFKKRIVGARGQSRSYWPMLALLHATD